MNLNKLYFDSVGVDGNQIQPHFHCPACGSDHKKRLWFTRTVAIPQSPTVDSNRLIIFTIPAHDDAATGQKCEGSNQQIELYVATHKDVDGLSFCIQKSSEEGAGGIPANWWVQP